MRISKIIIVTFFVTLKYYGVASCYKLYAIEIRFSTEVSFQAKDDTLSDEQLFRLFSEIDSLDQSNFDNYSKRKEIFKKNFDTIVAITRIQGFPHYSEIPKKRKKRFKVRIGCLFTFMHILQTQPDVILNSEIIELFKNEMKAERLEKNILVEALQFIYNFHCRGKLLFSQETQDYFNLALIEWQIKLKKCKNKQD